MSWRLENFGSTDATGLAADDADPDGDGRANLVEYACGSSPLSSDSAPLLVAGTSADGVPHLTLTFTRRSPAVADTVIEASSELVGWTPIATLPLGLDVWSGTAAVNETPAGEFISVTVEDPATLEGGVRRFLRVRFTAP